MAEEASQYIQEVALLNAHEKISPQENRLFWTGRSAEHAIVTESYLDPSEEEWRKQAQGFFEFFVEAASDGATNEQLVDSNLEKFAGYNMTLVWENLRFGLLSQILPLFSDHLYRESKRGILI